MVRAILFLLWLCCAHALNAATLHHDLLVHFEKDRSALTPEATEALDGFLATLDLTGDYAVAINGHTDSDGSDAYNEALSTARAEAVRDYLVAHGVDAALITTRRSGERDPIASNGDARGMAENRRVQVSFTRHAFADTEELRQALMEGSVQRFTIDPAKDQVITGAAGVQLAIQAGAWIDAQGRPVQGPVDLELTEATGLQAMLAHRLSTRSGDRLLETGGMLKVEARDAQGGPLRLKASAPMQVALPVTKGKDGMEVFLSSDGSDWRTTGAPIQQRLIARWVEPPTPDLAVLPWKAPVYRVPKGKPTKPVEPVAPRKPNAPRRASYLSAKPWWAFLFPEKARARAEARYAAAMARYEERVDRWERRMKQFEVSCAAYPQALQRYTERKAAWDAQVTAGRAEWERTVYTPALEAYDRAMAPLRLHNDSLWRARDRAIQASMQRYVERVDSAGTADIAGLNAYVFRTSRLGWINCDRFYDVPAEEKYSVVASDRGPIDAQVFLVFTDVRSALGMGWANGGRYVSPPVPRDEPAMLFAYAVIDGRAHVCMLPVDPARSPEITFRPSSFTEVKQLLAGLAGA
ncbi:MAG: OmpA family protein [Bacteroidetes bacterium]|nr:OmpA family protein [Bacteroidota bacterium]